MVTLDEPRALQLRHAEADEQFLTKIHGMHPATVEDYKGLAATVERKVSKGQAEMTTAASHRDAARDRRERLQRLVGRAPRKGFRSRCPLGVSTAIDLLDSPESWTTIHARPRLVQRALLAPWRDNRCSMLDASCASGWRQEGT